MPKANKPEDIWAKIDIKGPDDCWLYTHKGPPDTYGIFMMSGKPHQAHRVAYDLTYPGQIPVRAGGNRKGIIVLMHTCDNTRCCNPKHLLPGSQKENVKDCKEKGRRADFTGGKNPRAILNQDMADVIRAWHAGGFTRAAIAKILNVTWECIDAVCRNRRWVV